MPVCTHAHAHTSTSPTLPWQFEKVVAETMEIEAAMTDEIIGAIGNPEDVAKYMAFGCCCCICTACLSWVPFCCKMRSVKKTMEKSIGGPLKEQNMNPMQMKVKARLLGGPAAAAASPQKMERETSGSVSGHV